MRIIYNFLLAFACDVSRKKSAKFGRVYLRAGRAAENFCWHDVGFAVLDLRSNLYAEKPSIPETVAVPSASAGLKFLLTAMDYSIAKFSLNFKVNFDF